jgi:hypothetical protein
LHPTRLGCCLKPEQGYVKREPPTVFGLICRIR